VLKTKVFKSVEKATLFMDDHEFAKIHIYQCEKNLFSVGNMLVLVSASESLAYGS